jgi:hypothetical protein
VRNDLTTLPVSETTTLEQSVVGPSEVPDSTTHSTFESSTKEIPLVLPSKEREYSVTEQSTPLTEESKNSKTFKKVLLLNFLYRYVLYSYCLIIKNTAIGTTLAIILNTEPFTSVKTRESTEQTTSIPTTRATITQPTSISTVGTTTSTKIPTEQTTSIPTTQPTSISTLGTTSNMKIQIPITNLSSLGSTTVANIESKRSKKMYPKVDTRLSKST